MTDINNKCKSERLKTSINGSSDEFEKIINQLDIHTVCIENNCPNKEECFNKKSAAFMILGNICTRNCTFCNLRKGKPLQPDIDEPQKIAAAINALKMDHVIISSVSRDDLPDGGAGHIANVIIEIKKRDPNVIIETLIPDFIGDVDALKKIIAAAPHIINHNLETVPSLYQNLCSMSVYDRSIKLLKRVKEFAPQIYTKSGFLLGLGEKHEEVMQVMQDLQEAGCDFLTIGQYTKPSLLHHELPEYINPELFVKYENIAREMGFKYVASSPQVRSTYNAQEFI